MAKRLIKEGVLVVRDGKRIRPEIGKVFDLTAEEIKQLEAIRPSAIAKIRDVEEDPASVPTDSADAKGESTGKRRGRQTKADADTGGSGEGDPAGDL